MKNHTIVIPPKRLPNLKNILALFKSKTNYSLTKVEKSNLMDIYKKIFRYYKKSQFNIISDIQGRK